MVGLTEDNNDYLNLEDSEPNDEDLGVIASEEFQEDGVDTLLEKNFYPDAHLLYKRAISKTKQLSKEEEKVLAEKIRAGDKKAKDRFIVSNIRLVMKIASRYAQRGLPFLDLVQEGTIGLIRAVEKFDPEKGFKFSTYATWWIRQSLTRAILDQARIIRRPIHVAQLLEKNRKDVKILTRLLERAPTTEETAQYVGEKCFEKTRRFKKRIEYSDIILSTEELEGDSFLEDENILSPLEIYQKEEMSSILWRLLDGLSAREQEVIRLRYGVGGHKPHTLQQIADRCKLTKERIRQIESSAKKKLVKAREHLYPDN